MTIIWYNIGISTAEVSMGSSLKSGWSNSSAGAQSGTFTNPIQTTGLEREQFRSDDTKNISKYNATNRATSQTDFMKNTLTQTLTGGNMGWTGILSPLVSAGGSLLTSYVNNKANEANNNANIAANKEINDANIAFQREVNAKNQQNWQSQFDYQKALNKEVMAREDNAISRSIADAESNGINKLMVMGQPAQASSQTTFSGSSNQQAAEQKGYNKTTNRWDPEWAAMLSGISQSVAQIKNTNAQTRYINEQIVSEAENRANTRMDTLLKDAMKANTLKEFEEIEERIKSLGKDVEIKEHNLNIAKGKNLPYGTDYRSNNPYEFLSKLLEDYKDLKFKGSRTKEVDNSMKQLENKWYKEYLNTLKKNNWNGKDLTFDQFLKNRGLL